MKPKVAFYWCASCGGCEEAVLDLGEDVLPVLEAVEIVFWPVALDWKREDVEALPDGSLAAAFINGAIRTSEQEEMVRLLRRKAQLVFAVGACAQLGGIPGLANLFDREEILEQVYVRVPSVVNPEGIKPSCRWSDGGRQLELPEFWEGVRTLAQVVEVDYALPGCPPTPALLADAVQRLLNGTLPERGSVLAPDHALCQDCPRQASKPDSLVVREFKRPHQAWIDPERCMLAQGFLCLGPATRSGCGARCIQGNMPCTGCFGPTGRVRDFGAKALSGLASIVASQDEKELENIFRGIPDPAGTFYRYSLPSLIGSRKAQG